MTTSRAFAFAGRLAAVEEQLQLSETVSLFGMEQSPGAPMPILGFASDGPACWDVVERQRSCRFSGPRGLMGAAGAQNR